METTPIPYDLQKLLKRRPSVLVQPWTKTEKGTVGLLHECWCQVKFWEWGDEEDWALLEPLFDHNGEYIGVISPTSLSLR